MKQFIFTATSFVAALGALPALAQSYSPDPEMSGSGSDGSGALILLALIGVVIAAGSLTGRSKPATVAPVIVDEDDS